MSGRRSRAACAVEHEVFQVSMTAAASQAVPCHGAHHVGIVHLVIREAGRTTTTTSRVLGAPSRMFVPPSRTMLQEMPVRGTPQRSIYASYCRRRQRSQRHAFGPYLVAASCGSAGIGDPPHRFRQRTKGAAGGMRRGTRRPCPPCPQGT